jgi:hypothetical protein
LVLGEHAYTPQTNWVKPLELFCSWCQMQFCYTGSNSVMHHSSDCTFKENFNSHLIKKFYQLKSLGSDIKILDPFWVNLGIGWYTWI